MKTKKFLSLLTACLLIFQVIPVTAVDLYSEAEPKSYAEDIADTVDTASGSFKVGSETATRGETIKIPVILENNPGICAMSLKPVYDASVLRLESMTAGEGIWENCEIVKKYVWINMSGDSQENGIVVTFNFTVLDTAPLGDTAVSVIFDGCNYNEQTPIFEIISGKVTVDSADAGHLRLGGGNFVTGETVEIPVALENNPGLCSAVMTPVYDSSVLELIEIKPGEGVFADAVIADRYVWTNYGDISDNGVVCSLVFKVLDSAQHGDTTVSLMLDACNWAENDPDIVTVSGISTIHNAEDIVTDKSVSATCIETGLTEGSHCSVCGTILIAQETIPALGHAIVIDEAVPATCTETGLTEGSHCSVCNEVLTAQNIIPEADHKYGDWSIYKAPTCSSEGLEIRICENCNFSEQRIAPISEHTFDRWDIYTAPSCTESGLEYSVCTVCGESQSRPIAATGHDFDTEYTIDIEATTEAPGQKSRHCRNCSEITDVTEIPMLLNIKGDINGSGTVDTKDLTRLMKYIAGSDVVAYGPDLTGNGIVDTKDLSRLMKFLAGFKV